MDIAGLTLLERAYHSAKEGSLGCPVYVATCDLEIKNFCQENKMPVVMTRSDHSRATTRTAEAVENIERIEAVFFDSVLMVQGDEVFISGKSIELALHSLNEPGNQFVNILSRFASLEDCLDVNNVKAVVSSNGTILYFSRAAVPSSLDGPDHASCLNQTGVIGFKREALSWFNSLDESPLEVAESVDMNRVLENSESIRAIFISEVTYGIDTIEDLNRARTYFRGMT